MNPVAFEIFGLQIRWYGIIIAGGVLAAFLLSSVLAKKKGVSFDDIVDAFIWAFPIAIVGARAYYVAFEFKNFDSFADMINIRTGGLAIHGGLIAGIITAYIVLRIKKVNFWEYIDVVIPAVVLAQGIGRWGNFMNHEAFGPATTLEHLQNLHLPDFIINGMNIEGVYHIPAFLYESIWCLIGFIILLVFRRNKYTKIGMVTALYMIWYSIGRFFVEGLRQDSLMLGNIKVAQIASIILIIVGVIMFIKIKRQGSVFDNKYYSERNLDETKF